MRKVKLKYKKNFLSIYSETENLERIIKRKFRKKRFTIKELVVSGNVKTIDEEMFVYFYNLEKATIPDSIVNIGKQAFCSCGNLKEINMPSKLEIIEKAAFYNTKLKKINFPNTLKFIGEEAFSHCSFLEEIILPDSIKEIEDQAFSFCYHAKKIVFPKNLKKIGEYAFLCCQSIEEVVIPEGVEVVSRCLFQSCKNLRKVVLPKSVKKIEYGAFKSCKKLEEIRIPSSVEKFYNFSSELIKSDNLRVIIESEKDEQVIDSKDVEFLYNGTALLFFNYRNTTNYGVLFSGKVHFFDKAKIIEEARKKRFEINSDADAIKFYFWKSKNKFMPHYTVIENMNPNDIDLFYKNNNCNKWAEILRSTNIQVDANKATLFKLCYALGVFQERGSKRDEAVEYIKEHILSKMNENEIHARFDGLDTFNKKFDPMWADFFMKYYKDNPNFMQIYDKDLLSASYNNFDAVKKAHPNKMVNTNRDADVLLPNHVKEVFATVNYGRVNNENKDFAELVARYGYTQEQFEKLQEWYEIGKSIKEELKIFISKDVDNDNEITYDLLAKDNPLGAVLGNITNCCQVVGGAGESCVKYGMTMPNSKFMTFNYNKEILGQAWVWYDENTGVVCLDNIEVPSKYLDKINHDKELQKSFLECLKRVGDNFVSEMEEHGLKVNKVTVGEGYNDIKSILSKNFSKDNKVNKLTGYRGYSDAYKEQYIIKKK